MSEGWYIARAGGGQEGPLTRDMVLESLEALPEGTSVLLWGPELEDWREIRSASEFVAYESGLLRGEVPVTYQSVPEPVQVSFGCEGRSEPIRTEHRQGALVNAEIHPWRRLFARVIDINSWSIAAAFILGYLIAQNEPKLLESYLKFCNNIFLSGMVFYAAWLPVEAICISTIGTTPAKWCFGISIKAPNGANLDFSTALERAFRVWMKGDAFGIPLVLIVTRLIAYNTLTKDGITSWDDECDSVVHHEEWGVGRFLGCIVLVLLLGFILTVLSALSGT